MRVPRKRCAYCHRWFPPDPRTSANQSFCPNKECRRESRRLSRQRWWRSNGRELDRARAAKHRAWARDTGYWRAYRAAHPGYVRRDNRRRTSALKLARRSANQDMRRQISVGKLRDIQSLRLEMSANQDMILRRVDGILDFLIWKEDSANQNNTDRASVSP